MHFIVHYGDGIVALSHKIPSCTYIRNMYSSQIAMLGVCPDEGTICLISKCRRLSSALSVANKTGVCDCSMQSSLAPSSSMNNFNRPSLSQSRKLLLAFLTMGVLVAIVLCIGFLTVATSTNTASSNAGISSHVLDQTKGIPASGVAIDLYLYDESGQKFKLISNRITNQDGRVDSFLDGSQFVPGKYKAVFNVGQYFEHLEMPHFYPSIEITFLVKNNSEHYHVPILLSPFGFSTYRGS